MKIKEIYSAPEIDLLELEAEGNICQSPAPSSGNGDDMSTEYGEW